MQAFRTNIPYLCLNNRVWEYNLGNSPFAVPSLGPGSLAELAPISDVEDEHKVCGTKNPDESTSGLFSVPTT